MNSSEPTPDPDPELLIAQLHSLISNPSAFSSFKTIIQDLTHKATLSFDGPHETMQRIPLPNVLAHVGQEHGIFELLCSSSEPTSFEVLAEKSRIEENVLRSIMDYMVCQDMIEEGGKGEYKATRQTRNLVDGGVQSFASPAWGGFHKSIGTNEDERTAFQIGNKVSAETNFFQLMEQHPVEKAAFHRVMGHIASQTPSWLAQIPILELFLHPSPSMPESILFVDVGDGKGHQCLAIVDKYPDLEGRIVLQDLPKVVENARVGERVEKMGYDYFTEQPVKGERAYYMRQVLHSHNDETALRILALRG